MFRESRRTSIDIWKVGVAQFLGPELQCNLENVEQQRKGDVTKSQ